MRRFNSCVLVLFIITSLSINAQTNKVSVDLNLPVQTSEGSTKSHTSGIVDLGVKYNFLSAGKLDIGVSGNTGLLSVSREGATLLLFKPRLSCEMHLWKFSPYFGLGYSMSIFIYNYPGSAVGSNSYHESFGGNVNLGFKFHIDSKVYLNVGYDYISFNDANFTDIDRNGESHFFEFGIGLQW